MTIAVYPASFDPVHYGHLNIAARATRLFDTVVMAVFDRPSKRLLFNTEERLALLREVTYGMPRVRVESYTTLTVHYARSIGAAVMIRGLRANVSGFEDEFQMAQTNQLLDTEIETVVLMADRRYNTLSSSTVREIAMLGGDVTSMVPPVVVAALRARFEAQRG